MENTVDVTVIIPMYNAAKYIEKTVASILVQQPHQLSLEIIIVDDVSTDHSCEIVQRINSDKIKLVQLSKNGGSANARNTGIGLAQGTWIQFVDSDDMVCNDLYKKFEAARMPQFNCYVFSLTTKFYNYTLQQTISTVNDKRAFGHFGGVWNKFIKREICIEFRTDIKQHEDNVFIIDMMRERDLKIGLIRNAYYYYNRKNEQSKLSHFKKKEYFVMLNYFYNQIDKSDTLTKMYILEILIFMMFYRERPFFMSMKLATKAVFKLGKYLPALALNQNRLFLRNVKIEVC